MTDDIDALPAALWKLCIVTLLALPNYLQVLIQNLESKKNAQRWAWTHDPEIKNLMLYQLSYLDIFGKVPKTPQGGAFFGGGRLHFTIY